MLKLRRRSELEPFRRLAWDVPPEIRGGRPATSATSHSEFQSWNGEKSGIILTGCSHISVYLWVKKCLRTGRLFVIQSHNNRLFVVCVGEPRNKFSSQKRSVSYSFVVV